MKKLLLFILIASFLSSCKNGHGTLEGNVYWKYNNFVGNRPDAGSTAYLYPFAKNSKPIQETVDVQGNFQFDKVNTGDYLLIVVSKNTTASPAEQTKELLNHSTDIKKIFGLDINLMAPQNVKKFKYEDSVFYSLKIDFNNNIKAGIAESKKHEEASNFFAGRIVKAIPVNNELAQYALSNKIKIEKVTIEKDKTNKEVIDFGVTYF